MYDDEILTDLLNKMQDCLKKIKKRLKFVNIVSDLTDSSTGITADARLF